MHILVLYNILLCIVEYITMHSRTGKLTDRYIVRYVLVDMRIILMLKPLTLVT